MACACVYSMCAALFYGSELESDRERPRITVCLSTCSAFSVEVFGSSQKGQRGFGFGFGFVKTLLARPSQRFALSTFSSTLTHTHLVCSRISSPNSSLREAHGLRGSIGSHLFRSSSLSPPTQPPHVHTRSHTQEQKPTR